MKAPLSILLFLVLGGVAVAQSPDEDSLFGGDSTVQEEGAQAGDESFFGEGLFTDVDEATGADPAAALLEGGTTLGGDFSFSVEGALDVNPEGEVGFVSGTTELNTRLFVDARPERNFRVFIDGDLGYRTARGGTFALDELFADVELSGVFLRAGKQTVNWGVGYFYSPANLINLERIDPENPGEELSGPPALRAQLPLGTDTLTLYVLTNDFGDDLNLSAAARYDTLLSGFEVTTGGVAQSSGAWAVMTTGTGAVGGVTVFAEAVLEGNTDKVFVFEDETAPLGLGITRSESLFFSGVLGGRYTYETADDRYTVTTTVQGFFNGDGYDDLSLFAENPEAVAALLGAGAVRPEDLQERGRYYVGVSVASPDLADLGLTPSASWLASLSDGSGVVNARLTYNLGDTVTPRLEYRYRYGAVGTEYQADAPSRFSLGLEFSGAF